MATENEEATRVRAIPEPDVRHLYLEVDGDDMALIEDACGLSEPFGSLEETGSGHTTAGRFTIYQSDAIEAVWVCISPNRMRMEVFNIIYDDIRFPLMRVSRVIGEDDGSLTLEYDRALDYDACIVCDTIALHIRTRVC